MKVKPTLTVTNDFTKDFNDIVKQFKRDAVVIGIPENKSERKTDELQESSRVSNAYLLFINNYGSPANNIPARPVMEIGLRNVKDEVAAEFKKAAIAALSQGYQGAKLYYNRAGIIASSAVKLVINNQQGIQPPSPATLAIREGNGFKGTKALIVTGQLRNAITYVVREDI